MIFQSSYYLLVHVSYGHFAEVFSQSFVVFIERFDKTLQIGLETTSQTKFSK